MGSLSTFRNKECEKDYMKEYVNEEKYEFQY